MLEILIGFLIVLSLFAAVGLLLAGYIRFLRKISEEAEAERAIRRAHDKETSDLERRYKQAIIDCANRFGARSE